MKNIICLLLFCQLLYPQNKMDDLFDKAKASIPNNLDYADKYTSQLLKASNETNNEKYIAKSYYLNGVINYYRSKYFISNKYYQDALKMKYTAGDLKFKQACYNNMACNYSFLSMTDRAIKNYHTAYSIAASLKDSLSMYEALINIGLLEHSTRQINKGIATTKKALAYFEKKKDTKNIALCRQNLSIMYKDDKRYDLAIVFAQSALDLHRLNNYNYGCCQMQYQIGVIKLLQKKYNEADTCFEKSLKCINKSGEEYNNLKFHNLLKHAKVQLEKQNIDNVKKTIDEIKVNSNTFPDLDDFYRLKSSYYAKINNYTKYLENEQEFEKYLEEKSKITTLPIYYELQTVFESNEKEKIILKQNADLNQSKMRVLLLSFLFISSLIIILIIIYNHKRHKKIIKSLYEANVLIIDKGPIISKVEEEDSAIASIYNKIVSKMQDEKLYLKDDLSINDLSTIVGTNTKYISQSINKYSGKNFTKFVNIYRIDEAKKIILSDSENDIILKELPYRVGYINIATFYRQFKEHTGMTPNQFIKQKKLASYKLI